MDREKKTYPFEKGWGEVKIKDKNIVRKEIEDALGIRNRNSFYMRVSGKIDHKMSEVEKIESIFAKRGITDIWGSLETEVVNNQ